MNTTNPNTTSTLKLARRVTLLAAAASLLLAPCLFAQTPAPAAKEPLAQTSPRGNPSKPAQEKLYNLKFDGGDTRDLNYALREQLSAGNVVLSDSVTRVKLPAFELRNVRLTEIGRTIEFLGEGQLRVEITENAGSGNVWLIGRNNPATVAATVKMRSVPAPNLFANEESLTEIMKTAQEAQDVRNRMAEVNGGARGVPQFARMEPLKSQKIFVITGDEEGVSGLESLIKAAEQRLAESANANAAALAANGPKMRAVLAPHLFAQEQRWKSLLETTEKIRQNWVQLNSELLKKSGSESSPAFKFGLPWAEVDARKEQKVFVLLGTEAAIAGMESLIRAAEQLAKEEDEKISAELKADLKPAKEGKSEQ